MDNRAFFGSITGRGKQILIFCKRLDRLWMQPASCLTLAWGYSGRGVKLATHPSSVLEWYIYIYIYIYLPNSPQWVSMFTFTRFLDQTQRRTTVGKTPLEEWSARRRDLYLKTHNTHRETSMPEMRFEPTISAGERPQTYALERAATGTGRMMCSEYKLWSSSLRNFL